MEKYDLIVVGGGFSGTAAAIQAARSGLSVLLIEQANCLGGAAANCLVNPYMGWWIKVDGEDIPICRGIFAEINKELEAFNDTLDEAISFNRFNEEYLKIVMQRMLLKSGAKLLLRSYLTEAECENGRVESITVANKSGYMKLYADYFIDATGDGDLAHLAGFRMKLGRETDNLCQPMTLCFRAANVDIAKFREERKSLINEVYKKFRKEGKIKNPREDVLTFFTLIDGVVHFNSTRIIKLNPTDAWNITKAEIEAREQALELFAFMKVNFESFKNANLLSTAPQIGIRESRMICGEHMLTAEELKACTRFPDAIAYGNYDIDIHNPEGSGTSHYYFKGDEFYTIPYRSLIPKAAKNLLTAGRCISATHEAQASIRIMPIVCCIGQAAGAAIAEAAKEKNSVLEIDTEKLREKLYKDDLLNKKIY